MSQIQKKTVSATENVEGQAHQSGQRQSTVVIAVLREMCDLYERGHKEGAPGLKERIEALEKALLSKKEAESDEENDELDV